ncbi:type I restriction-modification system subunit M [Pedobacter sp. MC2016-14]|uniref:type I restriction-modification system subunit M n=1 Tax=Pedobacter sp. MC2016-14 TaxID=2897327 RepID=UPI001E32DA24|nr:class I SAM-dependent DNA methyltransferase [Pedobacter sp. MC2016-14]MCD0489965.1 type I restriction-modification system subunit M [Pedobacter sp. MC2016-14]
MTVEQLKALEDRLWEAADKLRVDSGLKASEYATPILGLIFLRFASIRYNKVKPLITAELEAQKNSRMQREPHEIAIEKCGFYLPPEAEYDYLLTLPEKENIAKAIKVAMEKIELYKPELQDSLPKDEYFKLIKPDDNSLPKTLLKIFADIPEDVTGDVFGKVYEYFLSEFALAEGQGGGEFFTPTSVVKLMVEIIEPYKGTIFDPACGSAGMFVQSSQFIDRRREELHDTDTKDLMVYGAERTPETVKLARMNLAVNGLRGEIKPANSYYEDPYDSYGRFDYVMANPPFNVDDVNLDRVKGQKRFNEYGIPQNKTKKTGKKKDDPNTVPNGNYLWINLFATSLKPQGRAALVMANSASDARNSEADIRKNLIKSGVIDCMLTLPKNMFYTVTLPATLWFFDKRKEDSEPKVLFIDARNIFRQVTRALREFTEEQIQNIATIMRLYRGETHRLEELITQYQNKAKDYKKQAAKQASRVEQIEQAEPENAKEIKRWEKQLEEARNRHKMLLDKEQYYYNQIQWLQERFPNGIYEDVTGLCKAATLAEIEEQDWSLNTGRYVGIIIEEDGLTEEEFKSEMKSRLRCLNDLNSTSHKLESAINNDLNDLMT